MAKRFVSVDLHPDADSAWTWSNYLDYNGDMIIVNVSEAKAQLTKLLQRAEAGEKVYISRRNEPIVELCRVTSASERPKPQFGLCAGDFVVPDDFDEPLPDDILKAFQGE